MTSALQPDGLMYPLASSEAVAIVADAYTRWSTLAQQAFNTAQSLAQQVANVPISPVAFNASFTPQMALAPFPTLPTPAVPADLVFHAPALPLPPPTVSVPVLPPAPYVSQMLGTLQDAVRTMLGGNPMSPALAATLRNRAYTEAFTEENRAVDQAYAEVAARGFFEPPGMLLQRVSEARVDARGKRQLVNADVFAKEQLLVIENLRQAVQLGTQLENQSVEVYRVVTQTNLETVRVEIEQAKLQVEEWQATVQEYDTTLKGEVARLDAVTREFEAQVEVYKANAQIAEEAGNYNGRMFQLNLAQEQAVVDTEMKRQDLQFEQMKYITSVMVEVKKTLATVEAQLAAAAMNAVNIGASASNSSSQSLGYNLGISYSGQLADGGGDD